MNSVKISQTIPKTPAEEVKCKVPDYTPYDIESSLGIDLKDVPSGDLNLGHHKFTVKLPVIEFTREGVVDQDLTQKYRGKYDEVIQVTVLYSVEPHVKSSVDTINRAVAEHVTEELLEGYGICDEIDVDECLTERDILDAISARPDEIASALDCVSLARVSTKNDNLNVRVFEGFVAGGYEDSLKDAYGSWSFFLEIDQEEKQEYLDSEYGVFKRTDRPIEEKFPSLEDYKFGYPMCKCDCCKYYTYFNDSGVIYSNPKVTYERFQLHKMLSYTEDLKKYYSQRKQAGLDVSDIESYIPSE